MKKILISGRLTKDIEIQKKGDLSYTKFTIVHTETYGKEKEKRSEFYNCISFGDRVTYLAKFFHQGDLILIDGTPTIQTYQAQDGTKRTSFCIEIGINNNVEIMRTPKAVTSSSSYKTDGKGDTQYVKHGISTPKDEGLNTKYDMPLDDFPAPKSQAAPAQAPTPDVKKAPTKYDEIDDQFCFQSEDTPF